MKKIAVIGSINMDMTVKADRIPQKGETIFGRDLCYAPGGKGNNQAVAAARLGGDVTMFGCVGQDSFGEQLLQNLKQQGVHTEWIRRIPDVSSGLALITVAEQDNVITVVSGANLSVTVEYLESVKEEILRHDIILLQNEIPKEAIAYAAGLCSRAGKTIVFNPAPAAALEESFLEQVTYLTPNEHEVFIGLERVIQKKWGGEEPEKEKKILPEDLLKQYPEKLIITMGSLGVMACEGEQVFLTPAIPAVAVDTTGAGDTFNGAFAYALAEEFPFRQALAFANTASGISIEKEGAQGGMPTLEAVKARMENA